METQFQLRGSSAAQHLRIDDAGATLQNMRPLLLVLALSGLAAPAASEKRPPWESSEQTDPELTRLDRELTPVEQAEKQGRLTPQDFQTFAARLRPELQAAYSRAKPSPANSMLYAGILRRLGEHDGAVNALSLSLEQDPDNAKLRLALGRTRLEQQDFAGGLSAAEAVLKREPWNREALALKHQCLGRSAAAPSEHAGPGLPSPRPTPSSAKVDDSTLPIKLVSRAGKTAAPPELVAVTDTRGYLSTGAVPPTTVEKAWGNFKTLVFYALDREPPEERVSMTRLRRELDSTESGSALVADLGGWKQIEREVDIRFARTGSPNTNAYARPLLRPDAQGRRYTVVLNPALTGEADAVTAPILAHELSHIRDFKEHSRAAGLDIPSEFAAHRTQVHVFEELKSRLSEKEVAQLKQRDRGRYQTFLALLWEDHLLKRFQTPADFARATGHLDKYKDMADAVFSDLQTRHVKPGSPQLDYHINGTVGGLYRNMSDERDIVDLIEERMKSSATMPTSADAMDLSSSSGND